MGETKNLKYQGLTFVHGNHKFKHPNSTQVWMVMMVMMVTEETSLKFIDPTQRIRGAMAEIDVSWKVSATTNRQQNRARF